MRKFISRLCEGKGKCFYVYVFGSRFHASGSYIREQTLRFSEDRSTGSMTRFSYYAQPAEEGDMIIGFRPIVKMKGGGG